MNQTRNSDSEEEEINTTNLLELGRLGDGDGSGENEASTAATKQSIELVPKDKGWAWMCCLGTFIATGFTGGGVIKSFGIMYVAFMEEFDAKAGHAAWIIGLMNLHQTLFTMVAVVMSIQFTHQAVVFIGGLFLCAGFLGSSFATQIHHLYFTYSVIGIGSACSYLISIAHLAQYFEKKRAFANGIALSGVGVGNFLIPMILRPSLDTYGLQGTLLIMSGISLNVCLAAMLLRPVSAYNVKRGKANSLSDLPNDKRWKPSEFFKSVMTSYKLMEWSLLMKGHFLLYSTTLFFFCAAYPIYFVSIAAYVEEAGHSKTEAAYVISIGGAADIIGRISTGFIVDLHLIPTYHFMGILGIISTIGAAVTPFMTNFVAIAVTFFISSMACGSILSLNPVFLGEYVGLHRLTGALGAVSPFMGAGILLGPTIAGTLKDVTGNWTASFILASACLLVVSLTLFSRAFFTKINRSSIST